MSGDLGIEVEEQDLIYPIYPFQGDHLSITPADSLEFVVIDFQKETLDIINLKNKTEEVVTYKVKTTAPEKYRVRPSTGVITMEIEEVRRPGERG
jgi:hypothetical protein